MLGMVRENKNKSQANRITIPIGRGEFRMNGRQPEPAGPENTAPGIAALDFMIGEWDLDYSVTQHGATTRAICGTGSIRPLFGTAYLTFDYQMRRKPALEKIGEAHAVIAWDKKAGQYRFFWFESSGTFLQANGSLSGDYTLALEWLGVNCTQIFRRVDGDSMLLEMRCPDDGLILRVDFARAARPA
jgi:hypothetical protein